LNPKPNYPVIDLLRKRVSESSAGLQKLKLSGYKSSQLKSSSGLRLMPAHQLHCMKTIDSVSSRSASFADFS